MTAGTPVLIGAGAALNAGTPLSITLSGLPHHSAAPRNIALVLVGVIVVIGFWAATRPGDAGADRLGERKRLIGRRERMLQDLVRLEQDHRRGKVDGVRYGARREELMQALEHVYGALDEDGAGPDPAGKAGVVSARLS